jgi:hypothetical protein
MQWHIICQLYVVNLIQKIRSELSRRRMASYTTPFRDLVFASTRKPTTQVSLEVSAENLILCPDAIINQPVIEYEAWLQNSISVLKRPPMATKGPHSHAQKDLIEDITLATKELHDALREEWSRQQAVIPSQITLPSFVIDNQCPTVDGGTSSILCAI